MPSRPERPRCSATSRVRRPDSARSCPPVAVDGRCRQETWPRPLPASFPPPRSVEGIFNSRGVNDWYEQTLAEASVSMLGDNSSGWQKANSPDAAQLDRRATGGGRCRESYRVEESARAVAGEIHGHFGACGGARHRGIHVLGFRRLGAAGTEIISERSHRHSTLRREHHRLGRCLSSAADRRAIRWRRNEAAPFEADR